MPLSFNTNTKLRSSFFILFLVVSLSGISQTRSFIREHLSTADSLSTEYQIPASVILGIAIIESSSGTSRNCKLLNNYFGIVGKNNLLKTRGIKTRYKQYPNALASFVDFCKLVTRRRFYKTLKGNTNYAFWIDALSKTGYSEIPLTWKQRVMSTIKKHELHEHDKSLTYEQ